MDCDTKVAVMAGLALGVNLLWAAFALWINYDWYKYTGQLIDEFYKNKEKNVSNR